ncbi:helix-turn-helix domain-containing protein [Niallia taxi]|uniref:hypothetical protein n=1 Tax=Niallia taxi TaxID=2499688 RepID=UPI0015F6EC7F|nr:hypothetical protein [Niallia taxi]
MTKAEQRLKEIEEFEQLKLKMIQTFGLKEIINHKDYYADLENQDVYSFKFRKVVKLKPCRAFGGYLVINLTPDDTGKQKNYYLHHVIFAAFNNCAIGAWRVEDKRITLNHEDTDIYNNHYLNLIPVDSQHNEEWKKKKSEEAKGRSPKKLSDEDVNRLRDQFINSRLPITTFATKYAKEYGIGEVTLYNILRRKTRINVS